MAKALKIVGTVVGVVAAVASTVATFGASLGISAAVIGTASTVATAAGIGLLAVGLAGLAIGPPKVTFSREGNPLQFQTNPQSGLPYPIGRTRMSGVRIHGDTYDAPAWKSESKQDVLSFAVLLGAGGPMEEIETFRADKATVAFDPSTGNATTSGYANWMAQKVSLGLAGASALALTFGGVAFPGWTVDHKLSGIAHALWDLRFDPEGDHFPIGVPEPEWIGKWVKVYDPRLDSTYPGGSGAQRALDESTYEWSNNPALHALTWALGRWQNGKRTLGIGAPVANIRVSDFVEAANVADANGWACGGVEWSTDNKWTILKRMLQAGGAEPTMTGAMIGCRVNTPRVSIATVTADKLLDSASFPTTKGRRDRFNTVIPRYRSEDHDWEVISGSPVQVADYVTEDGGIRVKEIDFPLVQKETGGTGDEQAGQLAAYEIVNSREAGPWQFTTGPEYIGVKTGDCITLDVPDEGVDNQPVIVRKRSVDPATLKISFEVETETEAKHAFALGKTTTPPPSYAPTPPDLTPPTPAAGLWSLTAPTGLVTPAIMISGVCEFPGADSVLLEYKKTADSDWLTLGKAEASAPVSHVVTSLEGDTQYDARVAYQSGNRIGDWLTLGPVTTIPESQAADARLVPAMVRVPVDLDGNVTSYADAQFDFKARLQDGTDISSFFTLSTPAGGNPAGLAVGYTAQHATITGGLAEAEAPATLTVDATGSGDYAGIVLRREFVLDIDYSTVMLQQLLTANDQNGTTPSAPISIGTPTLVTTHPDGTVTYKATVSFSYDPDPAATENFDALLWIVNEAPTSAAVTLGGPDAPGANERGGLWWVDVTAGAFTGYFLTKVDPTKWYTIGVAKWRKVASSVSSKGYIYGPITQLAAFQPASAQNVTAQIGGETAANVAQGAGRANSAIDSSNAIATGTKIGGSGGQTAANVATGTGRALAAITSGNQIATDKVVTDSLVLGAAVDVVTGSSTTDVNLDTASTWYELYSVLQNVGADDSSLMVKFGGNLVFGTNSGAGTASIVVDIKISETGGLLPTPDIMTTQLYFPGAPIVARLPVSLLWTFGGVDADSYTLKVEARYSAGGANVYAYFDTKSIEVTELKRCG